MDAPKFDSPQAGIAHAMIHSGVMSEKDLAQLIVCAQSELAAKLLKPIQELIGQAVSLVEEIVEQSTDQGREAWGKLDEEQRGAMLAYYATRPKKERPL